MKRSPVDELDALEKALPNDACRFPEAGVPSRGDEGGRFGVLGKLAYGS